MRLSDLKTGEKDADYTSMDTRNITGRYYDAWSGTYSDNSSSDKEMNDHADRTLKGVHIQPLLLCIS